MVRPLIEAVCEKIGGKAPGSILGRTWTFGSRSLQVVLRKEEWLLLPSYLQLPHSLSKSRAQEIRIACTMAEERRDFRERKMLSQSPFHRLCSDKFRTDGILMPFGSPREEFSTPNPTLFEDTGNWPMKDAADPLDGWDLGKVLQVSNISDAGYLGIAGTLRIFGHLLDSPHDNPHATLVTLFMNAVEETVNEKREAESFQAEIMQLTKYLPPKTLSFSNGDPFMVNMLSARPLVRDVESLFNTYMEFHRFKEAEKLHDVKMKESHTVIEQWPTRLKLQHGEPGWEDEFKIKHSSGHSGNQRYVEWKRMN
ncbi:MAG: hypothetical protein Q9165_000506 [Trypethelium subeluteriae]